MDYLVPQIWEYMIMYTYFLPKTLLRSVSEKLALFNSTDFSSHEIPIGNQSLDKHLVSYLGYLIGRNANMKCKYVIVSKDTGYDNIISFWKTHNGSVITRQDEISESKVQKKQTKTTPDKSKKVTNAANLKVQLNSAVQKEISNAGYKQSVINNVASIVVKHFGEIGFASNVHNELREIYSNYLDLYIIVKPIITKYSQTAEQKSSTSSKNSSVQTKLRMAGFSNDIINYVVSTISKNHDEKHAKQTIYRTIVAKYGQQKGLNIYNHIRKTL